MFDFCSVELNMLFFRSRFVPIVCSGQYFFPSPGNMFLYLVIAIKIRIIPVEQKSIIFWYCCFEIPLNPRVKYTSYIKTIKKTFFRSLNFVINRLLNEALFKSIFFSENGFYLSNFESNSRFRLKVQEISENNNKITWFVFTHRS